LAQAHAVRFEDRIKGHISLDENRTFRSLADWYYKDVAPNVLRGNILHKNRYIIDKYVMPFLGREKVKNISPIMLDNLFGALAQTVKQNRSYRLLDASILSNLNKTKLAKALGITRNTLGAAASGKTVGECSARLIARHFSRDIDELFECVNGSDTLAPSTIHGIRSCVSAIFAAAVKKELLLKNPVARSHIPRCSRAPAAFLDERQAGRLLSSLDRQDDFQFKVMVSTLLHTGMRSGELCGLRWEDVDLRKGAINICGTLVYNRSAGKKSGGRFMLQDTKTAAGNVFTIALPILFAARGYTKIPRKWVTYCALCAPSRSRSALKSHSRRRLPSRSASCCC
jgi:integrase